MGLFFFFKPKTYAVIECYLAIPSPHPHPEKNLTEASGISCFGYKTPQNYIEGDNTEQISPLWKAEE